MPLRGDWEGGGRRGSQAWRDHQGLRESGVSPAQSARKRAGLLGRVLNPPRPPLGHFVSRGIGRRRGWWRRGEVDGGGALCDRRTRGGTEVVSPTHLCLGSLLGCWVWSSVFLGPLLSQVPSGLMGPRGMGGRRGKEKERRTVVGRTLKDRRIGEVWRVFPQTTQPGRPAGVPGQVLHPLRPPLCHAGPGSGGREEVGRGGEADGARGPSRAGGSGEATQAFPLSTQLQEACWASGYGPLPSGATSSHVGAVDMGGRRREANGEGPSGTSPAHLGSVSMLGSWTWSSALQGQRHSWAPPAVLSLRPCPRAFSGPVGPKHRSHPPPKPHPYLSPAPHSQGLFWLFSPPPLYYYCGSVLPSSCCFIYIFIFLFFLR